MTRTMTASITFEDGWYIAQCLEVDIVSQGETEKLALEYLTEALELYVEPPTATLTPRYFTVRTSGPAKNSGYTLIRAGSLGGPLFVPLAR